MIKIILSAAVLSVAVLLTGCVSTTRPGLVGVERQQLMLVSSAQAEKLGLTAFANAASAAKKSGNLITSGPQYDRLLGIAKALRQQVVHFRDDTDKWRWQLILIDSPVLNASCAPGGKITFYTGLVDRLQLSDDEIAMIMGHEIAHALREHGREKLSEGFAQNLVLRSAMAAVGSSAQGQVLLANQMANYMFVLPNSREKESEADRIGLELASRAGYNPTAAITVWQKMGAANKGKETPQFLSTHPSSETRISELTAMQGTVEPLYAQARQAKGNQTIDRTTMDAGLPAMVQQELPF